MKIEFSKYHGTGNDFVLIDNRKGKVKLSKEQILFLCNRHIGVGADGMILLSKKKGYDFHMLYYNSDGNQSTMCGNGGRCIVAFAHSLGLIKNEASFSAIDGEHNAQISMNNEQLTMNNEQLTMNNEQLTIENKNTNYKLLAANCYVKLKMKDVETYKTIGKDYFIDTGSPHYVKFVDDVKNIDVVNEGGKIRNSVKFRKEGTNVDFVEIKKGYINVRSYERGVEDETLSCGTGVVASAIAYSLKTNKRISSIDIKTPGGELLVEFKRYESIFTNVYLNGPATLVFKGQIEI